MVPLARRNLLHDKVRLTVTLTGIVFAVVLIVVELGMFLGFMRATSGLIDAAGADLWVTSHGVPYVELGVAFDERKVLQVREVPGVARAEKLVSRWSQWKRPDGREESVQIIGFDPEGRMGRPWNLVAGGVEELKAPDSVIIDELYESKLGASRLGEVFEIGGRRARIVGFTRGIRTFTTAPYVFTTLKRALDYGRLPEDRTVYVLVKVAAGADIEKVRQGILARVSHVDVFTAREFSRMTQTYWMFGTGAGVSLLLAACLGLIVGFVIVAQTIYATTVDHIREFGTLKAMGAPNSYVYLVILRQAAISALLGWAQGMAVSWLVVAASRHGGASIALPWQMVVGMLFLTFYMCVAAAFVSIHKVTRLDPAIVFKA